MLAYYIQYRLKCSTTTSHTPRIRVFSTTKHALNFFEREKNLTRFFPVERNIGKNANYNLEHECGKLFAKNFRRVGWNFNKKIN